MTFVVLIAVRANNVVFWGFDTVYSGRLLQRFQEDVPPPCSG